jgi:hypothetical protein
MKLTYKSEKEVVNSIIHYLIGKGHLVWRVNAGMSEKTSTKGKRYMIRLAPKGTSDIIGVAKDGRFIAVECKYGSNKTSMFQDMFLEDVRKRGGYAVVAYGIEDLPKEL